MVPVGVSNATVAKPTDGSFKHYEEAKIQPSSNRPVNSISKGWGCELKVLCERIKHLPTMGSGKDMLKAYENSIPKANHYAGKNFTTQIGSLDCRLRHYLARLYRKTLCYSKLKTMLEVSSKLLIPKLNNPLVSTPFSRFKKYLFKNYNK